MADTLKMVTIILAIAMMLYMGDSVTETNNKAFGQDLFDTWVARDTSTNEYYAFSTNFTNATRSIDNPSTSGAVTGNTGFNFIDTIQMGLGFLKMIGNLITTIPMALINLVGIPYTLRFMIIIPLIILGGTVLFLMISGRR